MSYQYVGYSGLRCCAVHVWIEYADQIASTTYCLLLPLPTCTGCVEEILPSTKDLDAADGIQS